MSQTQAAKSPYPRRNFWGDDLDDDADESPGHTELSGTDKWEYVAWEFLVNTGTLLCSETGRELSDPELHLPKLFEDDCRSIEYGQHRHRRRIEPESGRINWGETTSTRLDPRPKDEFMQVVDLVLDWVEQSRGFEVGIDHRDRSRTLALCEKEDGRHDVAVLADVFRCIDDADRLADYGY